tara:strand:- start:257 stop:394 length:138 start_codon:yes stop_codon:yes gene_type:complete
MAKETMPKVNGKSYPYTPSGKAAAKRARKKKGDLVDRAYRKKGHD